MYVYLKFKYLKKYRKIVIQVFQPQENYASLWTVWSLSEVSD